MCLCNLGESMKIKKTIIPIGKTAYIVIEFNYTPPKDKDISVIRSHFIEMLQKQESMTNDIDCLIEEINKTTNLIEARNGIYQYLPKFRECFKSLEDTSNETIEINCEGKSIVYLSKKDSRLERDNLMMNLSKSINKFYILSAKEEEFEFKINNEMYKSSDVTNELTSPDVNNLLYYLGYEKYYQGNSNEALDILSISLKDKYLSKLVMNSFTPKECESCKELLLKAAHNKKVKFEPKAWTRVRFIEGIGKEDELLESGPCLMDLLEVFEKNGDMFIPVPSGKYRRIGKKVVDNYNVFKIDNTAKLAADFGNLVFSKEKMNISIRYEIPGSVTINPRQAKAVAFDTNSFNAKIFREQTIIKDGDRNIEKFQALVCGATLEFLKKLKMKGLVTFPNNNDYKQDNYTLIQLNISRIPVLSRSYILKSDSLDYVLDTYYEQRVAECKQKVIKFFIKKASKNKEYKDKKYSKEQIELLESYGLDLKGVYSGVDNKVITEVSDEYECRFFEFGLKYFSTLPKVESLLTKMNDTKKKLNMPELIMKEYIDYLRENKIDASYEKLARLLEEQKSIIRKNTRILAEIKLAKAITGDWWEGLKLDSKENYLYERGDKTLVIKLFKRNVNQ